MIVFLQHEEFTRLLKDQVCPLVIKLFAPSHKHIQITSQHPQSSTSRQAMESVAIGQVSGSPERPYFPIFMRLHRIVSVLVTNFFQILLTECEIFLSLLVKFLESDKFLWQRAMALEVLHKIVVQPDLLASFCKNYDERPNSNKIIQTIGYKLSACMQLCLLYPDVNDAKKDDGQFESNCQAAESSGFVCKGFWIPLYQNISRKKSILLDSLEKHEAMNLPEGYTLSLAYACITDFCQSIYQIDESMGEHFFGSDVCKSIFELSYSSLLAALSILLDASIDESVTDHILHSFSIIVSLACRLGHVVGRDAAIFVLCKAGLPYNYFIRVFGNTGGLNSLSGLVDTICTVDASSLKNVGDNEGDSSVGPLNHIVAVGTPCPTPFLPGNFFGQSVVVTAKNIQVFRVLINCLQENGLYMGDCWHLTLASLQHLIWILGMKPCLLEGFRTDGDGIDSSSLISGQHNSNMLTTTVMTEVPIMTAMLNKLFDSTVLLDDVALHHVIAALCKLSNEAMQVSQSGSREPSFFPIAKLRQTALVNLSRIEIFWKPVTAHLIEISGHPYSKLREWGAEALMTLIRSAMKANINGDDVKRQQLILVPLLTVCEIEYADVRRKQSDCLLKILQSFGQQLAADQWLIVIQIVASLVNGKFSFDDSLIKLSYETITLIVTDFLEILPFDSLQALVEADAKYGAQQCELNISLSALGQLWTISDFIHRRRLKLSSDECETVWLVLYNCISELCVDSRPPVRKSACQTLLQTIAAHGLALSPSTWKHMVWKILFPMLDKVRILARNASTKRSDSCMLGASNMLIHHSRDTESKQWAETSVLTLNAVVKVFNCQRKILLTMDDFSAVWSNLMQYIEYLVGSSNSEVSLAATKSFQEVLLGKMNQSVDTIFKSSSASASNLMTSDELPLLPDSLWLLSWQACFQFLKIFFLVWIRIAQSLLQSLSDDLKVESSSSLKMDPQKKANEVNKENIPGAQHFAIILFIFPYVFENIRKSIVVEDLKEKGILHILKFIINGSLFFEQSPFILPNTLDLTPVQEGVLNCCRVMYQEMLQSNSKLRSALPDLIRLLIDFTLLCIRLPNRECFAYLENNIHFNIQNIIPFAEQSLRTLVEFYANIAHYQEIIESIVLVDIVKCLAQPMQMKYRCASQNSWRYAASAFITISRLGIPVARQNVRLFKEFWPSFADAIDQFLFMHGKSQTPLNVDERKRHEFIDCQFIELIRMEILPYVNILPFEFVQQIIDLLNRGSISSADSYDVLDNYVQRVDLSRICFDALLSLSRCEEPDIISNVNPSFKTEVLLDEKDSVKRNLQSSFNTIVHKSSPSHLGSSAINSLLTRCKQVLISFIRDEQSAGHMRLPQERLIEMVSVLNAISTLIDTINKRSNIMDSEFFTQLINLYPILADCIRSSRTDLQVEQALVTALKSYQKLLLLQIKH